MLIIVIVNYCYYRVLLITDASAQPLALPRYHWYCMQVRFFVKSNPHKMPPKISIYSSTSLPQSPSLPPPLDACTTKCGSECNPWRFNDPLISDRDPANIKRLSSKTNVWPPTSWSQHTRVVIFSHAEPFPRRDNVDDFQLSCLSVWPTRVNLVSIAENYLKYLSSSLSPSILYGKLKLGKTLN